MDHCRGTLPSCKVKVRGSYCLEGCVDNIPGVIYAYGMKYRLKIFYSDTKMRCFAIERLTEGGWLKIASKMSLSGAKKLIKDLEAQDEKAH